MTDIIERAGKALEDYHKDHRAFGAEIARDGLGLSACTLLPETIEEIKRLRKQITAMALDNMASADQAAENNTRAEAAEAKLAVAVGALERMRRGWENLVELELIDPRHAFAATLLQKEARAALAEIKGEGNE